MRIGMRYPYSITRKREKLSSLIGYTLFKRKMPEGAREVGICPRKPEPSKEDMPACDRLQIVYLLLKT